MRTNNCIKSIYVNPGSPKESAAIYNFGTRLKITRSERQVKALKYENALLARAVSETRKELARLRDLLATS